LKEHLPAVDQLRDKLREAGAPFECEQIGISRQKLNQSHLQAYFLRRRYTVLDLAVQTGRWVEWAGQMA
jgi:glycerol-1-phosphate dehydrogenase [NAD(P)+]